eukprot:gene2683-3879_t
MNISFKTSFDVSQRTLDSEFIESISCNPSTKLSISFVVSPDEEGGVFIYILVL